APARAPASGRRVRPFPEADHHRRKSHLLATRRHRAMGREERLPEGGQAMKGHVRRRGKCGQPPKRCTCGRCTWAFVVSVGRDAKGKTKYKWVSGFRTKPEAEAELRRALVTMADGGDAFPVTTTVMEWSTTWLAHLATEGRVRARTARSYEQLLRDH